jgi:hypothetical protein
MSKKKSICASKLNAFIANGKADEIIKILNLDSVEKSVTLSKVVLRMPAFNHVSGKPFYAFVKQAGEQAVLVDVASGATQVVNNHQMAAQTNVNGRFKIDGVTYGKADTINGMPRYKPVATDKHQRLTKISPTYFNL